MRKRIKRLSCLVLALTLTAGLCACQKDEDSYAGSGEDGVIAEYGWSEYDRFIAESQIETDANKRALLLHQAEDILLDSGGLIPIFTRPSYYLAKNYLSGIQMTDMTNLDLTRVKTEDGKKDISVYMVAETPNMDPVANSTADTIEIVMHISSTLIKKFKDGSFMPECAESYSVSDDGLTYTFNIRKGLRWSDGSPLTAKDFEYSWKRAASSENAFDYAQLFDVIKGFPDNLCVKASDDGTTLTVELNNPCMYFLSLCAFSPFSPVKQEFVENAAGYKDQKGKIINPSAWATEAGIVSNGPFVLDQWIHNEKIVLKKNPYYYASDEIFLNSISFMLTSDGTSAYAAYVSDDICLQSGKIPNDMIPSLLDNPEFHVDSQFSSECIVINPNIELFEGMTREEAATFRKAIGYAIDRTFIVNVAMTGAEIPSGTYVSKDMHIGGNATFGKTEGYEYPTETGYYPLTSDLDKAREMLSSIGFEFGRDGKLKKSISIEYMYPSSAANEAVAVCIQADLAALGINLIPSTREWSIFIGERNNGNFETLRFNWSADFDDPYSMLGLFITGGSNNCLNFK